MSGENRGQEPANEAWPMRPLSKLFFSFAFADLVGENPDEAYLAAADGRMKPGAKRFPTGPEVFSFPFFLLSHFACHPF